MHRFRRSFSTVEATSGTRHSTRAFNGLLHRTCDDGFRSGLFENAPTPLVVVPVQTPKNPLPGDPDVWDTGGYFSDQLQSCQVRPVCLSTVPISAT